jgi:hypothetical protein
MRILVLILMVLAVVLLFLSAIGAQAPRLNLLNAGLAFWALAELLSKFLV